MRFSTLGFDDKKIDALDATLEFERLRNETEKDRDREKDDDRDDRELNGGDELDIELDIDHH